VNVVELSLVAYRVETELLVRVADDTERVGDEFECLYLGLNTGDFFLAVLDGVDDGGFCLSVVGGVPGVVVVGLLRGSRECRRREFSVGPRNGFFFDFDRDAPDVLTAVLGFAVLVVRTGTGVVDDVDGIGLAGLAGDRVDAPLLEERDVHRLAASAFVTPVGTLWERWSRI
jgi:hypothetical protein